MRFSFPFPTCVEGLNHPVGFARPAELVDLARRVEDLGFYALWANDHLAPWPKLLETDPTPPSWHDILIAMACCASVTSRIKLGLGVVVVPQRDPIILAKQVATLDAFSAGRVLFGVGIGIVREEFELARPREVGANRGQMLDEAMEAIRRLFTEPRASFEGEHYAFRDLALAPRPIQASLPIYLSGKVAATLRRAAQYGSGLMVSGRTAEGLATWLDQLRPELVRCGRDLSEIDVTFCPNLLLDDSHERALERFVHSRVGQRYLARGDSDPERVAAEHMVGTPAEVAERLHHVAAAGMTHCAPAHVAVDTFEDFLGQLRLYAEQLIPRYTRGE